MGAEFWSTMLAWLLTYTLQSTLLLGGAWLTIKLLPRLSDVVREAIWKSALLTGILTATIFCATGFSPFGNALVVDASRNDAAKNAAVEPLHEEASAADLSTLSSEELQHLVLMQQLLAAHRNEAGAADQTESNTATLGNADIVRGGWMDPFDNPRRWALGWISACLVFAGSASLLAGVARARLNRRLRDRVDVQDANVRRMLLRLCHRAGLRRRIRLTQSDRLRIPMAFGILRPEICLPVRALETLRRDELESLLAHELAHLVHRDPAWLLLCHLLESALFFQPLNRVAGRRIRELSEFRCDAWAADVTGRAAPLARCLTEVAGWLVHRPVQPALDHVAGMAHDRSVLHRRIERLVDGRISRQHRRTNRMLALIAVMLTGGSAIALPGVRAGGKLVAANPLVESGDVTDAPELDGDAVNPPLTSPERHDLLTQLRDLEAELSGLNASLGEVDRFLAPLRAGEQYAAAYAHVQQLRDITQTLQMRRDQLERELTAPETNNPIRRTPPSASNQPVIQLTDQEGTTR